MSSARNSITMRVRGGRLRREGSQRAKRYNESGDRLEAFAHVFFISTVWVLRVIRETCGHEMQATTINAPIAALSNSGHASACNNAMSSRRTPQTTTQTDRPGIVTPPRKPRRLDRSL